MITAPYNFVPLNKEIFYPEWSEQVSHDIPFEDSESGEIEITIAAKSPIFIRNHYKEGDNYIELNGKRISTEFCHFVNSSGGKEYYIPSASIKGMVRNVLEIMSFSKMRDEIFNDDTYAVRDLSKADNFYMSEMKKDTFGGWLKKTNNGYVIEDCGQVGRIKHEEIDKAFNIQFAKYFKSGAFDAKNQEHKISKYKYELIGDYFKTITLSKPYKSPTNAKYDDRVFYKYDPNGTNNAVLILTGQPTPRQDSGQKGDGKGFEFLFFQSKGELSVSSEVMEKFKFAYFDGRTTQPKESEDLRFWKEKLNNGEKIPVFFQKDGARVKHFGLSYLYKLPYNHSVKNGIPKSHFESDDLDLAQTIFGYISKNNKEALMGRVQFSNFKAMSKPILLPLRTEILGSPRASYYPIYVRQQNGKLYSTFMDSTFEIAGRKRYPIHKSHQTTKTTDTDNDNVGTSFTPLKEGVVFVGKLRYHNLKKAEIGAIISALTFHNTKNSYHNIGLAKSLGYGKIQIALKGVENIDSYLKDFETEIGKQIKGWAQSEQIRELLSMATEQSNKGNSELKYLELEGFSQNKTEPNRDYLRVYTELDSINAVCARSLLSVDEHKSLDEQRMAILEKMDDKRKHRNELLRQQAEQAAKAKKESDEISMALASDNIDIISNTIKKYPQNEILEQLKTKLHNLEVEQKQNKFAEVNKKAQDELDKTLSQKDNKKRKEYLEKFTGKWSKEKENKGSEYILDLVEQAKQELKKP